MTSSCLRRLLFVLGFLQTLKHIYKLKAYVASCIDAPSIIQGFGLLERTWISLRIHCHSLFLCQLLLFRAVEIMWISLQILIWKGELEKDTENKGNIFRLQVTGDLVYLPSFWILSVWLWKGKHFFRILTSHALKISICLICVSYST